MTDLNVGWEHDDEYSLLRAHGGWEFGKTLDEAWPKLQAKKLYDAQDTARLLELGPDDVVAEIGPGLGFEASYIAPKVKAVHLLDISKTFQNYCKRYVTNSNVKFWLIQPGDLSVLKNVGCTKVFANGVFIHFNVFDIALYVAQIADALLAGGRLLFQYRSAEAKEWLSHEDWKVTLDEYRQDKGRIFGLMSWNAFGPIRDIVHQNGFLIKSIQNPALDYVTLVCEKQ
jgi:cyclopropane fatty-acyl-phospholipid synthase-like methyltransferase